MKKRLTLYIHKRLGILTSFFLIIYFNVNLTRVGWTNWISKHVSGMLPVSLYLKTVFFHFFNDLFNFFSFRFDYKLYSFFTREK